MLVYGYHLVYGVPSGMNLIKTFFSVCFKLNLLYIFFVMLFLQTVANNRK